MSTFTIARNTRYGRPLLTTGNNERRTVILSDKEQLKHLQACPKFRISAATQTDHYLFATFTNPITGEEIHSIVPSFEKEALQRETFWKQRTELLMYMTALGIELSGSQIIKIAMASCIQVNGTDKGVSGYYDTLLENDNANFTNMADLYAGGLTYDPSQNELTSAQYSHTKLFAWIYFVESQVIASVARNITGTVSVLELGSSFGSPIFTKKYLLAGEDIVFYGVDIRTDLLLASVRFASRHQMTGMHFANADVTKNGWYSRIMRVISGHMVDVVVSSHLLEHLPLEPAQVIDNWLRLARRALIVSVPHTKEEINMSDHEHNFGAAGLASLADQVDSRNEGKVLIMRDHINSGILTIIKQNPDD